MFQYDEAFRHGGHVHLVGQVEYTLRLLVELEGDREEEEATPREVVIADLNSGYALLPVSMNTVCSEAPECAAQFCSVQASSGLRVGVAIVHQVRHSVIDKDGQSGPVRGEVLPDMLDRNPCPPKLVTRSFTERQREDGAKQTYR